MFRSEVFRLPLAGCCYGPVGLTEGVNASEHMWSTVLEQVLVHI